MARRSACTLLVLAALLCGLGARAEPDEAGAQLRRLAAAGDTTKCPRATLYIVPALPNVRDAATFELVRATYIDTVKRLAPAGAISDVIPTLTKPNAVKGGILVHTTVLFSGSCEAGKAAARTLHVKLLGDVRTLFYVPAPRAKSLFGDVYMVTVSHPFLADGSGAKLVAPAAPAGTDLAAQFSITWQAVPPSKIGELQAAAFKAAMLKQLPAGAGVYFTTMITEGVSYRFGNHWRACAAPVLPTVAKSAGRTSQGGTVWPPGQPADVKAGRLVFNTNIHGTVFNTAAGKAALTQFMQLLQTNTAAVFPPRTFGRMALDPGYGLRLVNQPAYPCTCEVVPPPQPTPPPVLTLAQAYGPTSATATASGAANVTWIRWEFTATPAGGAGVPQTADAPLVWWYGLKADTAYTVSVVGITAAGKRVPGANTLAIRTPKAGAPTVAAATATSSTQVTVRLSPPTTNQAVSSYTVFLCLKAQPTKCVNQTSTTTQLSFSNLTPGTAYIVSATAKIGGTVVPASNTLPLAMPQRGAPILLTAVATGGLTGAATAAAPGGASFSKYVFTAVSPSGAPTVTSTVTDPLKARFTGLRPATQYDVTVVGYTGTTPSPTSNMLSFVTPAANAPLNTGTPQSPTLVLVKVVPPTLPPINGGSWIEFDVTLCPIAGPQSACATKRIGGTGRRLLAVPDTVSFNAVPGTTYNSVTVAFSQSGEPSKQSMPAQVTTPAAIPWSVSLNAGSVTQTSAAFKISPPSEGGPYTTYVLSVCPKPSSGAPNWDACPKTTCLSSQLASCKVSGLTAGTAYVVSGVASTTDGVTSVRSTAASLTTLPWPAPTIGEVVAGSADLSTATVSIMRADLAPPTGWSQYNLTVCAISPAGACTYPTCTPVRAPPNPTSCALTGLNQGTTYRVTARAVRGSAGSATSAGKSFKTLVQDAPTLVSVSPAGVTSGLACLKAPAAGGPWAGFQCQSCYNGSCKQAPVCSLSPKRRLLVPSCQDSIACSLGRLESSTAYTVSCVAVTASGAPSPASSNMSLDTEQPTAPVVTPSQADPVKLQCTPPSGGPFKTCSVELCPAPQPKRRLHQTGCTVVTCTYGNSGADSCDIDLTGKVKQGTLYTMNSTAIMADGTRKSLTGAQGSYTVPLFPKPTVAAAISGSKSYNITITPGTTTPLASYPLGGWTYYQIQASNGETFTCQGKTTAGVPQPVTCTVTLASEDPSVTFAARAFQGDANKPKNTDLRSEASDFWSAPTLVSVSPDGYDSGIACLKAPSTGGPWDGGFQCQSCYNGSCKQGPKCILDGRRRLLDVTCKDTVSFACSLGTLDSSTPYTVSCVALTAAGTPSPASNSRSFSTEQPPAPVVTSSQADPVKLQCTPPSGGPFKTCSVELCPAPQPKRRLHQTGCTVVTCTYGNSGADSCDIDLTGKVKQGTPYTINSTAIMADGSRKSLTGAQGSYTVPFFPKPTVKAVSNGGNSYNVTITPDAATPLASYPAGGFAYYRIQASNGATETAVCPAQNNAGGVPQPVTCTVTLGSADVPVTFTAQAFQGDSSNPKDTDLRSDVSDSYTAPTIVSSQSLDTNSGSVCLQPDVTSGGVYASYNCTACSAGVCGAAQQCSRDLRRLLGASCDVNSVECFVTGLEPSTQYDVTCVGITATGAASQPSNKGSFSTIAIPPPTIVSAQASATDLTKGSVCLSPPAAGGPWAKFRCTPCTGGQCLAAQNCTIPASRRRGLLGDPVCSGGATECALTGLEVETSYTVTCDAVTASDKASPASDPDGFTTLPPPGPSVNYPAANMNSIECFEPTSGGPWDTCVLDLCVPQTTLRRLQQTAGCTYSAQLTCDFTSGKATCDTRGLVKLGEKYTVTAKATKSQGTRSSQTLVSPKQYQVKYYAQPTITNVDKTDVYTLTITPATNIGAYPVGGWTIIRVMPNKDAPNPNDPPIWYPVTDCIAINDANGKPQQSTCEVLSPAPAPFRFTVMAIATYTGKEFPVESGYSSPWLVSP